MTPKADAPFTSILTPCVRNCCLDEHDVCLGCCRTLNEILAWREMSDEEKTGIMDDCKIRHEQRKQELNQK